MKTVKPVSKETYERIGKAYLICSEYPDVFGDVTFEKFCSMFVDVIPEGESKRSVRMKAYAGEMYDLIRAVSSTKVSFTDVVKIGDYARELLARIDGEEDTGDE